ncbi:Rossmann-like domain-containing protein [candidate division KSB1 bacterium]
MNKSISIVENSKSVFAELIGKHGLYDTDVSVLVKTLTPKEAIGEPGRRDFPIIIGRERIIEAKVHRAKAHAFTDSPGEFIGALKKILEFPLTSSRERAIYIAALNAVLKYLNLIEKTVHCKDHEPEECAGEIASYIKKERGSTRVGLIGLNPAIAENLIDTFGAGNVIITDLDRENIGSSKWGVVIRDGAAETEKLIKQSDLVLLTGSTFVNGTVDIIMEHIRYYGKDYLIYGVTCAGLCELANMNRICPFGRND